MSFLAAVLASAGEVEMTDLDKNVSELKHKITNLEYDIKDAMEQRYMKYTVVSRDVASMLDTAQSYEKQIDNLLSRINNQTKREVQDAMSDLKIFKSTLEENKCNLSTMERVLTVSMNLTNNSQANLSLANRLQNIQNAKEILTDNETLSKLDVYKHLMREHQRLTDVLHSNCITTWRKQIQWLENDADSQESWTVMLKISGNQEDIYDNVSILQYFECLNVEVKQFSDKLINLIVKPIICQNLKVDVTKTVHISTITLKNDNDDVFLSTTIKELKNVFNFLCSTLPTDVNKIQFISYLGSFASEPFCKMFKDIALFNAVPVKYNKLKFFENELNDVLEFNSYLSEIGFLGESTDELIKMYIANIDNLFFTKISQMYYDQARNIIKKDLYDLVEVDNDKIWEADNEVKNDKGFCQKIFSYPQSKVSKSLLEFLNLINTIASEMSKLPENNSWRYHDIINNIIIMYCDVVPFQHSLAQELHSQRSAIIYNNIMYFTRKLTEMSPTYKNLIIVHLLEKLKNLATEILHSQCKQLILVIEEIMNQSAITELSVNPYHTYDVEESLSDCYKNLSTVSSLWRDILPSTVYCKFIGYPCNGFFECIINKLFSLKDISVTSSEQLYSSILNKIIKDIPTLFPEPKEVHRYIPKWWQLNEIMFVLSSSLKDIEKRWADGKGPLANELKAEQIKNLLKALFQNTDRRAALLKHISATAQS